MARQHIAQDRRHARTGQRERDLRAQAPGQKPRGRRRAEAGVPVDAGAGLSPTPTKLLALPHAPSSILSSVSSVGKS